MCNIGRRETVTNTERYVALPNERRVSMCQDLVTLCEFVQATGVANRIEVIRAVCISCERVEVCPAVSATELEQREQQKKNPQQAVLNEKFSHRTNPKTQDRES